MLFSFLKTLKVFISPSKCCSSYVNKMRYINHLKQDDGLCVEALQTGSFLLFHRLSPLLRHTERGLRTHEIHSTEVASLLDRVNGNRKLLRDSVLIGCSEDTHTLQATFCLDVGHLDRSLIEEESGGRFIDLRRSFFLLNNTEAPLVAKAQALLRWHQSNTFCSATGKQTVRNQAGSHRVCVGDKDLVYYPKMSPVVIVLVSDGSRCLLGRQASFPIGLYSALAGFCDMGETLEQTLRREIAEEVGLEIDSYSFSSSQHWPFPHSSFMMACHALVNPAHSQLHVDHSELEDARWFTLQEIQQALKVKGHRQDTLRVEEEEEEVKKGGEKEGEGEEEKVKIWLPPSHAVAHTLITQWAHTQNNQGP